MLGWKTIKQYIYRMDAQYKTLQTIFNIVKEDPQPTTYKCRPREIILRQFQQAPELTKQTNTI